MCDVVVSYIFVILSFLAERPDEDGVVLRRDEGDSIEIDESRHGHGSDDDGAEVTPTPIQRTSGKTRVSQQPLRAVILCYLYVGS